MSKNVATENKKFSRMSLPAMYPVYYIIEFKNGIILNVRAIY